MSHGLSPQNEAFLAHLVAKREYVDRDAALEKAVSLLRRRRVLIEEVNAGVAQLYDGKKHLYSHDELDRFFADVESREKQRFPAT